MDNLRANETPEQKKEQQSADKIRKENCRANETPEQKKEQQSAVKNRMENLREKQTKTRQQLFDEIKDMKRSDHAIF